MANKPVSDDDESTTDVRRATITRPVSRRYLQWA
jgi:hypothetical protein